MGGLEIGLLSMVAIVVLIYAGMHVSIALCLVSLVGVWAIKGNFALAEKLLALAASDAVSSYEFGVVPLFVLMGFWSASPASAATPSSPPMCCCAACAAASASRQWSPMPPSPR